MKEKSWYKPSEKKPVQGKKVLCMHKGDLYVAQRLKDYWFSIPFHDSEYSRYFEPELWQEIDFPEGLTGIFNVIIDNQILTMDEVDKKYPMIFEEIVEAMKVNFDKYVDKEFQEQLLKKRYILYKK